MGQGNRLLRIWAANEIENGRIEEGPFANYQEVLDTIDSMLHRSR